MQQYTYNWEVKDILTQFLHAFDGAIIKRTTKFGIVGNNIAVRYVYAPKQRVLHDLINKAQHLTLPVVSFWISKVSRDPNRVFNKLEGQNFNEKYFSSESTRMLQPVPVDITVNVSILTRFQSDMDQIVSNFVPYSDPYFVISWTKYDEPNVEIRSPVIWDNNLQMSYPVEQQPTNPTRVTCETTFVIKGWLFKNVANPIGRIYKIDANFYPVSGTPTLQNINELVNPNLTESFTVTATPRITSCSRWLTPVDYSAKAQVQGSNLNTVVAVYLSGSSDYMFNGVTTVDLFSGTPLSATYPALENVVPIQDFSLVNDSTMALTYQAPQAGGYFDIIVVNAAGYTLMTQSVAELQLVPSPPYINGIEVTGVLNYTWENAIITWDASTFQWQLA